MAPAPTFAPASALSKPARLTGVKPQVQAAKPAANPTLQSADIKAAPRPAPRKVAPNKTSTIMVPETIAATAVRQSQHVERRLNLPSSP
jgi:hypothetical protein